MNEPIISKITDGNCDNHFDTTNGTAKSFDEGSATTIDDVAIRFMRNLSQQALLWV